MIRIATSRVPVGAAKAEGRQPSHDGEYVTVIKWQGRLGVQWIVDTNAGVCGGSEQSPDLDTDEAEEFWADCVASAKALNLAEDGQDCELDEDFIRYEGTAACGSEATSIILSSQPTEAANGHS